MHRYQARLFGYLLRLVGNKEVAEELFQETWIRVYNRCETIDQTRPFSPWLFRVATNLAMDHHRRRKAGMISFEDGMHQDTPEQMTPERVTTEQEEREMLQLAVDQLGTEHQPAMLLFLAGQGYDEISETLKVPLGTVKSRLHYATTKMLGYLARKRKRDLKPVRLHPARDLGRR